MVKITNHQELNSAVMQLNAQNIGMCNVTTQEELNALLVSCKDLMVAVYKYNQNRIKQLPENKGAARK